MRATPSGLFAAFALITALLLSSPSLTMAAGFVKVGTFGFNWEGIHNGSRQTAMGSADMAGAQGPSAILLNTAPLPTIDGVDVEYGRSKLYLDVDHETMGMSASWRGLQVNYVRAQLLTDPMLIRTAYQPEGTGEYFEMTSEMKVLGASYDIGQHLEPSGHLAWTIGAAWRRYDGSLADFEYGESTYDVGTSLRWRVNHARGWTDFKGGFWVMNQSGKSVAFDERESSLPEASRYGLSAESVINSRHSNQEMLRVVVAYAEANYDSYFYEDQDHLGAELTALDLVSVRAGNNSRLGDSNSWGVGLRVARPFMGPVALTLDYGRFDTGWRWNEMWSARANFRF